MYDSTAVRTRILVFVGGYCHANNYMTVYRRVWPREAGHDRMHRVVGIFDMQDGMTVSRMICACIAGYGRL